ncbi:MAG: IS4 family transposase [Actinobacteria bacterium]|nr:IS4 family transposase [Actinomycetota bacterium]
MEREWARETFAGVGGDARLRRRLVRVAEGAARRPAGEVTRVYDNGADREGAFRLLENRRLTAADVARASHDATARACAGRDVIVALDGSTLSLIDHARTRELGGVGAWKDFGRGIHVHTALAIDIEGVPIGICGQLWWTRQCPTLKKTKVHRAMETETRHGVELLREAHARLCDAGSRPWFQLDRGFDVWPILQLAHQQRIRLTVRAIGNRSVLDGAGIKRNLRDVMLRAPAFGTYFVDVPAAANRPARRAEMEVHVASVRVPLAVGRVRREYVLLQVVRATELGAVGQPLEWILFTTVSVTSIEDARAVIHAYTRRWRIEEFHRTWKRGLCNVEDSQLRSREALVKWATILAAVATRANRLTQLRAADPAIAATTEFSAMELNAIILLRKPKGIRLGHKPSLAQAIRWVADLGGYTGKSSGGPPGATVIGRGLADVELLVRGLRSLAEAKRSG